MAMLCADPIFSCGQTAVKVGFGVFWEVIHGIYSYQRMSFGRDYHRLMAETGLVRPKSLGTAVRHGHARSSLREQLPDALAVVVSDQERAGLDIVTCGDYFLDADLAGRSWHHYPLQRWQGLAYDELQPESTRSELLRYPPGTLLNEIYTSWRWPIVTGKIEPNPRNPLEYAKLVRMTQSRTRKPVKFGTVSGQVMALFLRLPYARVSN